MAHEAGGENESFLDEIALLLETTEAAGDLTPSCNAEPLAGGLSLLFLHVDDDDMFAKADAPTDARQQAHAEPSAAAAPNRSMAHRMRQREELYHLRDQVRELEERLETLQHTKKVGSPPSNTGDAECREDAAKQQGMAVACMWERIAKNQMSAKQRAEVENAKLREMLQGQLKIARGLERVLRKRSFLQMDAASLGAKRRRRVAATSDAAVYEQLKLRLDDRYRELEAAFEQNGLSTRRVDLEDVCVLSTGDTSQLSIEILYAKVLPFDFASTSAAVWSCSTRSYLQLSQGFYSAEPVSNDEITATFEVPLQVRRQSVMLHVYVALKRYRETNEREVYAWESWSTVGSSCKSYDGIQLLDHGWTVVQSLPSSDPTIPATIVRSCSRLFSDEQSLPKQSPIGALSDILIASFNRNYATLYETVESFLLSTASR